VFRGSWFSVETGEGKGVKAHFYCTDDLSDIDCHGMARKPRISRGGIAYHVMNRTWGKIDLFEDAGDYEAFERVLAEAAGRSERARNDNML